MKKVIFAISILMAFVVLQGLEFVPNEMIVKTKYPQKIMRGKFQNKELNSFLRSFDVKEIKPILKKNKNNFFVIRTSQKIDWKNLKNKNFAAIDYIQPNYLNSFYAYPNDTFYVNQQLEQVKCQEAWDVTIGSRNVNVAIIDSGIAFEHPDLQNNIYVNQGEIPDNGIDDDNNGYIDDYRGWDFVDAPEMGEIGLGDFTQQDNLPEDENWHGTHVAGIIGADSNNNLGICGINWNVSMMILRAGFRTTSASGFLQDDDAAAAIIYAADNGANVINMSWGDSNFSQIISDACQYAHDKGTILVAAAGNKPEPGIAYPARLSTTISVGAVNGNLSIAGFSSFGPHLDIVAPGVSILSTYDPSKDEIYQEMSGTSMSAPFVTGGIALYLSEYPNTSQEEIKTKLFNSARDLGDVGFDSYYGNGLLDLQQLMESDISATVEINAPASNEGLATSFDIIGTAKCDNFFSYNVMYTDEIMPTSLDWKDVATHNNYPEIYTEEVENNVLASFNINPEFSEGNYNLRLDLSDINGHHFYFYQMIVIDQTPPELEGNDISIQHRYNNELSNYYFSAKFNEPVKINLSLKDSNENVFSIQSNKLDSLQILKIPAELSEGNVDITLSAINISGLNYGPVSFENAFYCDKTSIELYSFDSQTLSSPKLFCPKLFDFDDNGKSELLTMQFDGSPINTVQSYELINNNLSLIHTFNEKYWPKDIGSLDGEKNNIFGINLDQGFIYMSVGDNPYPEIPIYQLSSVYGGQFIDFDNDGKDELAVIQNSTSQRTLSIYQKQGIDLTKILEIPNTTPSLISNSFGPNIIFGDFDNDGEKDILAGDSDGDVMMYEFSNNGVLAGSLVWQYQLPVPNAYYFAKGDFNGNGIEDFAIAGFSSSMDEPENNYWYVVAFESDKNNSYVKLGETFIDGNSNKNSFSSGDVDSDDKDELILAFSPNLYVVKLDGDELKPIFKGDASNNYQITTIPKTDISDAKILVNNGSELDLVTRSNEINNVNVPSNFKLNPVDESKVYLHWDNQESSYFKIYRKYHSNVVFLDSTSQTFYYDENLTADSTYFYAVSAVDLSQNPSESNQTLWKSARPNPVPKLVSIKMSGEKSIKILFDNILSSNSALNNNFKINHGINYPQSIQIINQQKGFLLNFANVLPEFNDYTLLVKSVFGVTGVPVPDTSFAFEYNFDTTQPEIIGYELVSKKTIKVKFSEEMLNTSLENLANYELVLPSNDLNNEINSLETEANDVKITLKRNIKFSPQPYILITKNLFDLSGNKIKNNKNKCRFNLTATKDLKYVEVVPNPLKLNELSKISFINLPLNKKGKIWIYNIAGNLVYKNNISELDENNNTYTWNLCNSSKNRVGRGIYFYVIKMDKSFKKGKIALIK